MSQPESNPIPRTPDEAAMLAFVEGEMSGAEEIAFRRGLRHAPQIVTRLEAMRRDKAALRASMLRELLVPASVRARVDQEIDREALNSAAGTESLVHGGRFAESRIHTRVISHGWMGRRVGVGLAMAAGLALVTGGAFMVLNRAGGGNGVGPRLLDLAASQGADGAEPGGGLASGRLAADPDGSESSEKWPGASVDGDGGSPRPSGPDAGTAIALVGDDPLGIRLDESVGVTEGDVTPALASTRLLPGAVARQDVMRLAEQNRLALRVSVERPREVIAALEAAVGTGASGSGWRVVGDAPATLAGSIGVTIRPFDESMFARPGGGSPDGSNPAGPSRPGPGGRRVSDDAWLLRPTEDAMAVYLAEVDMSPEGLAALDRELTGRGGSRSGFAALADPLDQVIGPMGLLVPAHDVIWWYHPPREWSKRTLVPVVVERR